MYIIAPVQTPVEQLTRYGKRPHHTVERESGAQEEGLKKGTEKSRRKKKPKTHISFNTRRSSRLHTQSAGIAITRSQVTLDLTTMDPNNSSEKIEKEKSSIISSVKDEEEKQLEVAQWEAVESCLQILKGSDQKVSNAEFLERFHKLVRAVGIKCQGLEDSVKEVSLQVRFILFNGIII